MLANIPTSWKAGLDSIAAAAAAAAANTASKPDEEVQRAPNDVIRSVNRYGREFSNGRPLSDQLRLQILQLAVSGHRPSEISRRLLVSHGCVSKIISRFRQTGSVNPGQVGGRKSRYLIQAQLLANRLGISGGKRIGGELLQTNNNAEAAENSSQSSASRIVRYESGTARGMPPLCRVPSIEESGDDWGLIPSTDGSQVRTNTRSESAVCRSFKCECHHSQQQQQQQQAMTRSAATFGCMAGGRNDCTLQEHYPSSTTATTATAAKKNNAISSCLSKATLAHHLRSRSGRTRYHGNTRLVTEHQKRRNQVRQQSSYSVSRPPQSVSADDGYRKIGICLGQQVPVNKTSSEPLSPAINKVSGEAGCNDELEQHDECCRWRRDVDMGRDLGLENEDDDNDDDDDDDDDTEMSMAVAGNWTSDMASLSRERAASSSRDTDLDSNDAGDGDGCSPTNSPTNEATDSEQPTASPEGQRDTTAIEPMSTDDVTSTGRPPSRRNLAGRCNDQLTTAMTHRGLEEDAENMSDAKKNDAVVESRREKLNVDDELPPKSAHGDAAAHTPADECVSASALGSGNVDFSLSKSLSSTSVDLNGNTSTVNFNQSKTSAPSACSCLNRVDHEVFDSSKRSPWYDTEPIATVSSSPLMTPISMRSSLNVTEPDDDRYYGVRLEDVSCGRPRCDDEPLDLRASIGRTVDPYLVGATRTSPNGGMVNKQLMTRTALSPSAMGSDEVEVLLLNGRPYDIVAVGRGIWIPRIEHEMLSQFDDSRIYLARRYRHLANDG